MDQGVHEFRILVVAGDTEVVRGALPGLADWLSAPPAVFAHLPIGTPVRSKTKKNIDAPITAMLSLSSPDIRVMALKRTEDGKALLVRLQETTGIATRVTLALKHPFRTIPLKFSPLEIKTLRIARNGTCTAAHLIKER
jgi:alpha-mannosidase